MGKYTGVIKSVLNRSQSLFLGPDKKDKESEFSEQGSLLIPDHYNDVVREILTIFTQISKRYEPVNEKGEAICALLDLYGVGYYKQAVPHHEYNIVTLAVDGAQKVIMSHYDLIPLFNSGFLASNCLRFDGDDIQGALDNTITNAVVLYMLKNNLIPSNTSVVFSVEEESGGNGAAEFMKRLSNKESVALINLDVTNEFKDCDRTGMSIEYDAFSIQNLPVLWDFCNSGFSSVTFERVGDDMCTILRHGGRGASFCLPTKKGIHSFKNRTSVDKLYKYTLELERLLNSDLDFSLEDESRRVSLRDFKQTRGLSVEDILEKFQRNSSSSRESRSLFDRDWYNDIESRSALSISSYDDEGELISELAESWSDDARGCESLSEALGGWIDDDINDTGLEKAFVKANKIVGGKWFHKFLVEAEILKKELNRGNTAGQHPFDDDEVEEQDQALTVNTLADLYSSTFEEMEMLIQHINLWIKKSIPKNELVAAFKSIESNRGGAYSEKYLKDFLGSCKKIRKSIDKAVKVETYDEEEHITILANRHTQTYEGRDKIIEQLPLWLAGDISKSSLIGVFKIVNNVEDSDPDEPLVEFLSDCKALKKLRDESTKKSIIFNPESADLNEYSEMDIADAFVSESSNVAGFAEHLKMWKQGLYANFQLEELLREVACDISDDDLASFWRYAYTLLGQKLQA